MPNGTRNRLLKSTPVAVLNVSPISFGPMTLATSGPKPRIIRLKSPCALARTSFGKNSSTKM